MNGNGAFSTGSSGVKTLRDAITALTEQRDILVAQGAPFAAHLIDLAIIELRLTMNNIAEEELSGLCDHLENQPLKRGGGN